MVSGTGPQTRPKTIGSHYLGLFSSILCHMPIGINLNNWVPVVFQESLHCFTYHNLSSSSEQLYNLSIHERGYVDQESTYLVSVKVQIFYLWTILPLSQLLRSIACKLMVIAELQWNFIYKDKQQAGFGLKAVPCQIRIWIIELGLTNSKLYNCRYRETI